ncbi:two-component system response regulator YesN [Paenibacillus phyllosphaerae]|uniref:Two-component system response regulator YesN n=1 Tax=Paenibacillus phyllosphaerae TaxID=274593 RepID=A0A7W5FR72_9BACL|nr:response regulator [Paenibacillus phyllosphaerae]MBB3113982.1 two-component system response regulator YesN [Paenibacillus phyllosphaerae]
MVTVLIIDDEEPVREAIRILGNWQELGVTNILEAADGKQALRMLEQYKPDLVMVDMKMPEMNGVEFLRVVEEEYPDLMTIVISGYNDFEFTHQAIRSKVVDYLLKPVNRKELNQALRKAVDVLEAKRKSKSELINRNIALNMSLPKLKEKIYLTIFDRSFKKQSNEAFLPLVNGDKSTGHYLTAVLRVMNFNAVCARRFSKESTLLQFAVANVLSDVSGERLQAFSFADPKRAREMLVVYSTTDGYAEDLAFSAAILVKKAVSTLADLFGMQTVSGIGAPRSELMELADSYEEAMAALNRHNLLESGTAAAAAGKEMRSTALGSRIAMIGGALEAGNVQQAKGVLADYLSHMKQSDYVSLAEADLRLRELQMLLSDLAVERGTAADQLPAAGASGGESGQGPDFADFPQFEAAMHRILEQYSELIRQGAAGNRPFHISDIRDYIDRYYFEDIKITMFTEKYYLSREYLMKLFKQQYGVGIHEYMQKVRMDKAKELLLDPNLKIQEISEMLGYKDKNYFSKAFRNYYGLSPSEFRTNPASV